MSEGTCETLMSMAGARIVGIQRVFYLLQGSMDRRVGALQVVLNDGRTFLYDAGADGESLKVSLSGWQDPFSGKELSPENREFIATSGKWTAVDVSHEAEYARFVGSKVDMVQPVRVPSGKIVGVILRTPAGEIRTEVEADDLYVQLT